MKQKQRYRRKSQGHGLVLAWPMGALPPEEVAQRVSYVGSPEHKARGAHPSYCCGSSLRSDASRCDPSIDRQAAERALRAAVARRCVSEDFDGGYPRCVWGWLRGTPYVARLLNHDTGDYKGWPIGVEELPTDRDGRLATPERAHG
ncbi:MAG: hypothetical protein AB1505_27870 [Candidatus Latescibacterota bacterium]